METQVMKGQSGFIHYFMPVFDILFIQNASAEWEFYGGTCFQGSPSLVERRLSKQDVEVTMPTDA